MSPHRTARSAAGTSWASACVAAALFCSLVAAGGDDGGPPSVVAQAQRQGTPTVAGRAASALRAAFGQTAQSPPPLSSPAARRAPAGFVRVSPDGTGFAVDCDPFYVAGFNSYTLLEAAAEVSTGSFGINYTGTGRQLVVSQLADAQARGLNTVRIWAFTVMATRPMQTAPGVYDEALLNGLDFIMEAARARNIYVVLVLADWWTESGGVVQYLRWSRSAWPGSPRETFFTDRDCQRLYKENAAFFINRVNSRTGVTYRDDATILSWELLNEGRCRGCSSNMQRWIASMARYVASLDPTHLRTVGEEGFWPSNRQWGTGAVAEPGVFARTTGQSFHDDHAPADITHATCHLWPEDWGPFAPTGPVSLNPVEFAANYVTTHGNDCKALRKPLIVSEFGCSAGTINGLTGFTRNAFYAAVHRSVEAGIQSGLPIAGSMFWIWHANSTRARTSSDTVRSAAPFSPRWVAPDASALTLCCSLRLIFVDKLPAQYAVYDDQSVMSLIVSHASALRSLSDARKGTLC